MTEKIFINQVDYSQKRIYSKCTSNDSKRFHLIALWMLIAIKRVFCSYHSVEINIKLFTKGPFLSHFLYFLYFITNYP